MVVTVSAVVIVLLVHRLVSAVFFCTEFSVYRLDQIDAFHFVVQNGPQPAANLIVRADCDPLRQVLGDENLGSATRIEKTQDQILLSRIISALIFHMNMPLSAGWFFGCHDLVVPNYP